MKNMIKKNINNIIQGIIIIYIGMLTFLFSFSCSNNIWRIADKGTDSSVFMYVARVILDGGMPYRDTFDHKGPLVYLINVLGIKIDYWRGIYIIEMIAIFITFYAIYRIARLKCGQVISLFLLTFTSTGLLQYFEGGNLTEEYAIPFIAIAIWYFTDYFIYSQITNFRLVICGIACAAVLLIRVNMASVWLVMCLGVVIQCLRQKQYRKLIDIIIKFVLGFLTLFVPILAWLAINDALVPFYEDYIQFNFLYSNASLLTRFESFHYFFNTNLFLLATGILLYRVFTKRESFDILYLIFFMSNIIFVAMSGNSYGHYGMVLVPSLIYPYACMGDYINKRKDTSCGIAVFFYLGITVAFPVWSNQVVNNILPQYLSKNDTQFSQEVEELVSLVKENSKEDDKIIVASNYDMIYNLSNRFAASKYSYCLPCDLDQTRGLDYIEEIANNHPKVIIMGTTGNGFCYEKISEIISGGDYIEVGQDSLGKWVVYQSVKGEGESEK